MTLTRRTKRREHTSDPAVVAEVEALCAELRHRDRTHPQWPVIDSYARLSDDKRGEKTEVQTRNNLRVIRAGQYRLGEVYVDNSLSAWNPNGKRPGFLAILSRLESGEGAGAVVPYLDRLTRQVSEATRLIAASDRKAIIISRTGSIDVSTADGRKTLILQAEAAEYESSRKGERIRDTFGERRDTHRAYIDTWTFGHAALDQTLSAADRATLAAERDAVAWGINARISGVTWNAIAAEWNARGLLSRTGKTFHGSRVRDTLDNPRHAGILTYGHRHNRTVLGLATNVDPIVDRATWDRFAADMDSRKGTVGRTVGSGTSAYLLVSLVRCECGAPLTGSPAREYRGFTYHAQYRCATGLGCKRNNVATHLLDAVVKAMTLTELAHPDHADQRTARADEVAKLRAGIERIRGVLDHYDELRRADLIDDERHTRHLRTYAAEIARTEAEIADLLNARPDEGASAEAAVLARWGEDSDTSTEALECRRRMVRAAFTSLSLAKGNGRGIPNTVETVQARLTAVRVPATKKHRRRAATAEQPELF